MTAALVVVAASNLLVAALLWLTTARAADGRMPVNGLAGIRTGATMATEEGWRAGHRAALPMVTRIAGGFVLADLLALGLWVLDHPDTGFWVAFVPNVLLLPLLWPLVRRANRAARTASGEAA